MLKLQNITLISMRYFNVMGNQPRVAPSKLIRLIERLVFAAYVPKYFAFSWILSYKDS